MKALIVFAHTFWSDSRVNKALLELAKTLSNVTINNLSTTYLDGKINSEAEIALLKGSDKIIFQFPLFWFSTPSILKEWEDRVLTPILYGDNPQLLKNKIFQIITTLGGSKSSYDGHHGFGLKELLSPINHSFAYLGCKVEEPFAIYSASVSNLPTDEYLKLLKD